MLGEVDLWRRLAEAITAEIDGRCDGIVSGNLDSMERYRFETGFVRGLQWVLDQARQLSVAGNPERGAGVAEEESEDAG